MIQTVLGKRFRWFEASTWLDDGGILRPQVWHFEPVVVGADFIEYTLAEGPHIGRHAIQQIEYHRVAPGIETTAWCEESGAVVHITWYLDSQTTHRFRVRAAWQVQYPYTTFAGDNQDPEYLTKIRDLAAKGPGGRGDVKSDDGYFELLES
jgi:phenolic acid decarboxylase